MEVDAPEPLLALGREVLVGAFAPARVDAVGLENGNPGQREEVALQAASLASGFVVSPAVGAVGRALGLDYLDLERGSDPTSPNLRLSAWREVWPGVYVTYGREFGATEYNEFMLEYSLAKFLRLKANVSDADGDRSRATLFRRVERAGIDLIFFFNY